MNKNGLNDLYCFKNYGEIKLKGTWDSDNFQDIKINIRPCKNSTDNNSCKSSEIITERLEGGYLVMHFTSNQQEIKNFKEPLKQIFVQEFEKTSLKTAAQKIFYFGSIKIESDIGIFGENMIYKEAPAFISSKLSYYSNDYNPYFFRLNLRLDYSNKTTSRRYDNILDVLSKMGGLLRILTIIATIFLKPFLEAALLQRVSNDTFDYQEMFNNECDDDNNRILPKKIKLTLWEYVQSKIRKKEKLKKTTKILLKCIKIMKKNIDITFLINKMFDVEKIKLILNNSDLEILKDQKPKIILDHKKFKKTVFRNELEKNFQKQFFIVVDSQNLHETNSLPLNKNKIQDQTNNNNNNNDNNDKKNVEMAFKNLNLRQTFSDKEINLFPDDLEEKGVNIPKRLELLPKKNFQTDF